MKRSLDVTERLNWTINQVYPFNIQVVIQISKQIPKTHIQKAFFHLNKKHPLLNSKIICKRKPSLQINSLLTLSIKQTSQKNNIRQLIYKELHTRFVLRSGPLVRVLIAAHPRCYYIVVTINHIICDGMSGAALVKEFLKYLDKIMSQKSIKDSDKLNEFISFEKRLPLALRKTYKPEIKLNLQKSNKQAIKPNKNLSNPVEVLSKTPLNLKKSLRSTFTLQRSLTHHETQYIINQCSKHKIKINALTNAALLLSLSKKLTDLDDADNKKIIVRSLINMRPYLLTPIRNDYLGHMISTILQVFDIQKQDLWKLAQFFQKQFNDKLSSDEHIRGVLNFHRRFLSLMHKDKLESISSNPLPSITVSNLGNLTTPKKYKNFSLKKLIFNSCNHMFRGNNNQVFVIVHSLHNKLNLNFHFVKPEVTLKEAKLLVEATMKYLK